MTEQDIQLDLLYSTPNYPKLVEAVARQCYQSYDKVTETSHSFIRGIINKGHLSVASVGNIVFGLKTINLAILTDLLKLKEMNNFIRWTLSDIQTKYQMIISFNMLTFLDFHKEMKENQLENRLYQTMLALTDQVDELAWFYNKEVELAPSENCFIKQAAELYQPLLLSEDYHALKALGFSEKELDIHATITVNYMTDRSTGLQLWRHGDMTGGTELSQRYVNRGHAQFRDMIGFESGNQLTKPEMRSIADRLAAILAEANQNYNNLLTEMDELGVHQARAKEVARSILPNAVVTQIIQCRPLRQWKHLFSLRDSVHAQIETMQDVRSMKQAFVEQGIDLES